MSEMEQATKNVQIARQAVWSVEGKAIAAAREAARRVEAEFADQIAAAKAELREAEVALIRVRDKCAKPHEWEGRIVTRTVKVRVNRWGPELADKIERGVVETVTSSTVFAANLGSDRKPDIGFVIVRLLKKGGMPGKDFMAFHDWQSKTSPWSPEASPSPSPSPAA